MKAITTPSKAIKRLAILVEAEDNSRMRIQSASATVLSRIKVEIERTQGTAADYWDFRDTKKLSFEDSLFQYPAMMVPAMQRQVIAAILKAQPAIKTIADPFLGSGTIMVQAMLAGKAFVGQDINPLALLVAKTRASCLDHEKLCAATTATTQRARADQSRLYARRFHNQAKWFSSGASIGLSRLRRAILGEPDQNCRLFLWTCLAETVRNTSNSRTSTFKLHIRPEEERHTTTGEVLDYFDGVARENLVKVNTFTTSLGKKGYLTSDLAYKHPVILAYGNSAVTLPPGPVSHSLTYDLVVTSPPYGDNRTTVPYGQAAWLPLQWVALADIDPAIPASAITSMYGVDGQSLGGRRPRLSRSAMDTNVGFGEISKLYVEALKAKKGDGLSRYVHFAGDLASAIRTITSRCTSGAYLVWTLGHRTINQVNCPLTDIVEEMFAQLNVKAVARIHRKIPSKRIPSKNNMSKTIGDEFILMLRSGE